MKLELATTLIVFFYLAVGTTTIAFLANWLLKRFAPKEPLSRKKDPDSRATSGALDFPDVIPAIQSLLSASRPTLRLKNVLVPVDFSESSLRALPYASFLASQFGCAVTLLYVVDLNFIGDVSGVRVTRFVTEIKTAATQVLGEVAPSVAGATRTVVRIGEPVGEVLREVAESDIDLVIIGKSRSQGWWRRLRPSVAARIRRRVPCPTLVAL